MRILCIVGCCALLHFSVDHGCLTSSEHPSKARVTQTSLDLAIIFLANRGHTPRVSNTSPTAAPQPYGCSPFFFFFLVLAPFSPDGCENELVCGCIECADALDS